MKSDVKIREDVQEELAWQPNLKETEIGVIVDNGIVTLTGVVDHYMKKLDAENAAKSVKGVKAVADDIEVRYKGSNIKNDTDIAKAAVNALKWNSSVPDEKVIPKVENGYVYLTGKVNWGYQKSSAERAVEGLQGVKNVFNNIEIESKIEPSDIKNRIQKAYERSAQLEAKNIIVSVDGNTVTLSGTVDSVAEKEEAKRAAFLAPGVNKVINNIEVSFYREYA